MSSVLETLLPAVHSHFMGSKLTIVVVEEDRDRALGIVDALQDTGDCEVFVIANYSGLSRKIAMHEPDIVLIDVDNPTRDMLEELSFQRSDPEEYQLRSAARDRR